MAGPIEATVTVTVVPGAMTAAFILDAYTRYDTDPRCNGPEDLEAFRDAILQTAVEPETGGASRSAVEIVPIEGYPDLFAVHIDGHSMDLQLRRMQRNGEAVYQPREMPDLGVYRNPMEAVRGALGVAFRTYIGDGG